MKSFAVAGDNHLRKGMWQKKPGLSGDSYESFNQLIKYCTDNGLNLCLAGDLFDTDQPEPDDVHVFLSGMARMKRNKLEVFYIQGQHEFKTLPWAKAVSPYVRYVHRAIFEPVDGFKMYGIDQCRAEELQEELANVPDEVSGLLMHQWEKSSFPIPDAWNFDLDWLPKHIRFVALGDYHKKIDLSWDGGIGFYTGSQHMTEVSEDPQKSFCVVTVDGESVTYERIPLKTRPVFVEEVLSPESLDKVTRFLLEELDPDKMFSDVPKTVRKPIFVVSYLTDIPESGPRLLSAAGSKVHLFTKPKTLTQHTMQVEAGRPDYQEGEAVTLASVVGMAAPENTDKYKFIHDLVTKDVSQVLTAWREKLGVNDAA